jgi:hypothetical protein
MPQVKKSAYVVEKPFIYHRITVGGDGFGVYTGHGFAKCHPNDNFDKTIGKELAELRAKVKAYEGYSAMLAKELQRIRNAKRSAKSAGQQVPNDPLADFFTNIQKFTNSLPKVDANQCVRK